MNTNLQSVFQLAILEHGHPNTSMLEAGHLAKTMYDLFRTTKSNAYTKAQTAANLILIAQYPEMSKFIANTIYEYGDCKWSIDTACSVMIALLISFDAIHQKSKNPAQEEIEVKS